MLHTLRIAATSVALLSLVISTGCSERAPNDDFIIDDNPFISGCAEGSESVSCADFSDVDLGVCPETLGFGLVDGKCVELSGCEADGKGYCMYETLSDCLMGCGEDSALGQKAIGHLPCDKSVIEGNLNPNWPPEWGDTDPDYAFCDIIYVCYETHDSKDPEVAAIEGLYSDDVELILESQPFDLCPEGTQNWNLAEMVELTEDVWPVLCSFSLLEDTREMRCFR